VSNTADICNLSNYCFVNITTSFNISAHVTDVNGFIITAELNAPVRGLPSLETSNAEVRSIICQFVQSVRLLTIREFYKNFVRPGTFFCWGFYWHGKGACVTYDLFLSSFRGIGV
jgi:hypothetical protein